MRYADENAPRPRDFVRRRRWPTHVQYAAIFLVFYALIIGTFLVTGSAMKFGVITFFWVGAVAGLIAYTVQTSRDVVLATEYQNAIFASAVGIQSLFTIIARPDGSIVYFDRGLQQMFPRFSRFSERDVQHFLQIAGASSAHADSVISAVTSRHSLKQLLALKDGEGNDVHIVLAVEPVEYPGMFSVLRARPFVERAAPAAQDMDRLAPYLSFLRQIADKLPLGVIATDAAGAVNYINTQAEAWLGYSQGLAVQAQLALSGIVRPKDGDLRVYRGEGVLTARNGEVSSAYLDISAVGDAQKPDGVVALIYPPTPNSAVAAAVDGQTPDTLPAVRGLEENVEDFIASAPIAIVRVARNGAVVYANRAFHELTHNTLRHQLPRDIVEIVTESKRAEAAEQFRKILDFHASKMAIPLEFTLPDRAQVSVSMYVSKLTSGETVLYLMDVTEQKNLELRFAHSQKMQAVGQLAGGVAHDFNNLLTAMIGFCDLLLMRHPAGDQSFADIMQIKQNANRAANLVRQLLAFSRRQTLQPKMLDVTDVLAELSNLIRRLIGENIELKMVHGRNLGMVRADQGQLEQVIINLAVNARDAMLGGGTLSISTSFSQVGAQPLPDDYMAPAGEDVAVPAGDYIVVEVTDTGTGIPADVMQKIFEPFFSTKEVGSGTGLGLATVYGIIKQTGGNIFVRSREGQGTSFFLYFPRYKEQDTAVRAQVEAEAASEKQAGDLTGIGSILLVEDETPVRTFAGRALRNKGYTVTEADCGESGLEVFKGEQSFDLIITDVIMPGMNGPTMIEHIHKQHPDMKVIFISGYAEDIFMSSYGVERSFNFLAKPFTLKQLASKVKEVLSKP